MAICLIEQFFVPYALFFHFVAFFKSGPFLEDVNYPGEYSKKQGLPRFIDDYDDFDDYDDYDDYDVFDDYNYYDDYDDYDDEDEYDDYDD